MAERILVALRNVEGLEICTSTLSLSLFAFVPLWTSSGFLWPPPRGRLGFAVESAGKLEVA